MKYTLIALLALIAMGCNTDSTPDRMWSKGEPAFFFTDIEFPYFIDSTISFDGGRYNVKSFVLTKQGIWDGDGKPKFDTLYGTQKTTVIDSVGFYKRHLNDAALIQLDRINQARQQKHVNDSIAAGVKQHYTDSINHIVDSLNKL